MKVGDRVRVTKNYPHKDVHGLEGTIEAIRNSSPTTWPYLVNLDEGGYGTDLFSFSELKLISNKETK